MVWQKKYFRLADIKRAPFSASEKIMVELISNLLCRRPAAGDAGSSL